MDWFDDDDDFWGEPRQEEEEEEEEDEGAVNWSDEQDEEEEDSAERQARWDAYSEKLKRQREEEARQLEERRRTAVDMDFLADMEDEEEDGEDVPPPPAQQQHQQLLLPYTRPRYPYPLSTTVFRRFFDTLVEEGNPCTWELDEVYGVGAPFAVTAMAPGPAYRDMRHAMAVQKFGGTTHVALFFNLPFTWMVDAKGAKRGLYYVDPSSADWMALMALLVVKFVAEFSGIISGSYGKLLQLATSLAAVRDSLDAVHNYNSVLAQLWSPQPMRISRNSQYSVRVMTHFVAEEGVEETVSVSAFYGVMPKQDFGVFYRMYG